MTVPPIHPDFIRLFDWLWLTSAKVSVLIIFILLVKTVLKKKISASLHYLLWSVVIVSLLLPWTPQSSISLYNLAKSDRQLSSVTEGAKTSPLSARADTSGSNKMNSTPLEPVAIVHNYPNKVTDANPSPNQNKSLLTSVATSPFTHRVLFFIWIVGMAVFMAATLLINRRFAQGLHGQSVDDTKLLTAFHEAKQKLSIKRTIPLILTKAVKTPSLFGLFRPKMLLPIGVLDEFSSAQLNHVFVHELVHFKRKDVLVNWLTQGLLIAHWFNPIFWYAFSKMREDQEIACDVKTLEHVGITDPKEYAYTLIKLAESNLRIPRIASLAGLLGSGSQIKRRITMLKIFRKASVKWSILVVTLVIVMGAVTLTNAKANAFNTVGTTAPGSSSTAVATETNTVPGKQTSQSNQSSSVPRGSFDYQKYLPFTPLLPSYTAGYELTYSQIERSQNTPPGSNSITYLAAYGSHSSFVITEVRPNDFHPAPDQSPKVPIQIGNIQATMMEHDGGESIQFTKDGLEYIVTSISGGGVPLDELKKISASIAVPAEAPPTEITIMNTGFSAADELSFKAIQPGEISVPLGYKLQIESTNVDIKGDAKVETLQLNYKKGSSYLTIWESDGEYPFGDSTPVVTPESDFTSKLIDNTAVELRHSNNRMLPAAKFTLSQNGLQFILFSDLQETEVEKVVASILQASAKQ